MLTKVHLSQSYGFSSSRELDYKESWAPKNWCFWRRLLWRRLLRVPWTARRSNQFILKEISPEYSLEGLMLKLQYFGHPDAKNWLIWKDPDAGKDWRQEEKGTTEDEMVGWHHQLNGLRELVMGREAWRATVHGFTKSRTKISAWTELQKKSYKLKHWDGVKNRTPTPLRINFKK